MEVSAPSMSSGPPNKRLRQAQLQFVKVAKLDEYTSPTVSGMDGTYLEVIVYLLFLVIN